MITRQMVDILEDVVDVLSEGKGRKIVLLSALYGGGKTHTLITIYHALKRPGQLVRASAEDQEIRGAIQGIAARLSGIAHSIDVVVVDGFMSQLAPHPVAPLNVGAYSVRTLWGYIAHCLGNYSLLKLHDEQLVAPGVDDLVRLFENRRVVILVDELANYMQNVQSQTGYLSALKSFIERLAKAVDIARNVVLVASVPVSMRGEGEIVRVEATYAAIRDSIDAVVKSLSRVAAMYVEPVSPRNVPALLRVRLFESVDHGKASEMMRALSRSYSGAGEVFDRGLSEEVVRKIVNTYPFHPIFVDTIIDILDKHHMLQKTRDLLRISRHILRSLSSSKDRFELVMPWHIDLATDEALASYLTRGFEGFRSVIESDVRERARDYEKPWLAQILADALLVRTFVYGGGLAPKHEVFPTPEELAVMVYEPASFSDRGLLPKDIADAIEWIRRNLVYVLEDERTHRLWFTQFITPIKYVEDMARRISDVEVVKEIDDLAKKVLKTPISTEGRRRGATEVGKVFDRELSTASFRCTKLDYDGPRYVLYACVDVPQDPSSRLPLLEEMIYTTARGGTRRYANIVFVAFPDRGEIVKEAFDLARRRVACRKVETEGLIDRLIAGYSGEERDIVRGVLRSKLESYCGSIDRDAHVKVLSLFNTVAYPSYSEGRNTVNEVNLSIRDSVIEGVEHTLQSIQPRKIVLDMDFETLNYYLKSVGIDLAETPVPKWVRDVVDYFYSNPRLPATKDGVVKRAIADGVSNLSVGLLCRDNVYFKAIEACKTDAECRSYIMARGEGPGAVSDDCQVLSWRDALREQLRRLKSTVEGLKITEYLVNYGGELYRVEDVVESFTKFDIEILKTSPLLKRERVTAVRLQPEKEERTVEPGQGIELKFTAERLGDFVGELHVRSSLGEVSPGRVVFNADTPRNEIAWRYSAPRTGGDYQGVISLLLPDGTEVARAVVLVSVVGAERCTAGLAGVLGKKVRTIDVEIDKLNLKPLQIISARLGGFSISGRLDLILERDRQVRVSLEFDGMRPDEVYRIVSNVVTTLLLGKAKLSIKLNLSASEPRTLPELPESELNELSQYVTRACLD